MSSVPDPSAPVDLSRIPEFELGPVRVSPASCTMRGGRQHRLEPRVMQVVCALAREAGRVVARDDLIKSCWGGRIVGDDALSRCIYRLRQVAVVEPGAFQIDTIPRVGYRLTLGADTSTPTEQAVATVSSPRPWRGLASAALTFVLCGVAWLVLRPEAAWDVARISPLVATSLLSTSPAMSPRGDLIAFSASEGEGLPHLYLQNLSGGAAVPLTHGASGEMSPAWAPSGERIAYNAGGMTGADAACKIMTVDIPAGVPREIARCKGESEVGLTYTPDGRSLFYVDRLSAAEGERIMRLDLANGATHPVTDPPPVRYGDLKPTVSPSGRNLAFIRILSLSQRSIMTLDLRSGALSTVWKGDNDSFTGLAWLDDQTLLVANENGTDRCLFAAPLRGKLQRLGAMPMVYGALSRGTGDRFAFETWNNKSALVEVRPGGVRRERFSTYEWLGDPAASSDGTLAFFSNQGGGLGLWIARPDAAPTRVLNFGAAEAHDVSWSPDGRRLSLIEARRGSPQLLVIDSEGRRLREVELPGAGGEGSTWDADGTGVLVTVRRPPSATELWRLDLASGVLSPTPLRGWSQPVRDGASLYAMRSDMQGTTREIWRLSPERRLIFAGLPHEDMMNWTVQGGDLFYVDGTDPQHQKVVRRSVRGPVTQTWPVHSVGWHEGLGVNPVTRLPVFADLLSNNVDIYLIQLRHHG